MGNISEKDEFYEKERKAKEAQCLETMKKAFLNHDELDLTRFLLARNYDMKKSKEMYENYLDWKKNYNPGNITIETFEKELFQDRAYFMGHAEDNTRAPIFYFIAKNHFPSPHWQDTVHFGCVIHDAFVALSEVPGSLTFNGVVDLQGVSIDNIDMKLIKRGIEIYQDYFPERMGICYVIGLPGGFIGLWHIIEGLLDERTRKRVVLLKENQKITEFILPHLLPKEIGGEKDLNHNEFLEVVKSYYSKASDSLKDG